MIVRELVNKVTFQVTGQKQANNSVKAVQNSLERVGAAGMNSGRSASRGMSMISRAAAAASSAFGILNRRAAAAGVNGARGLSPLQRALNRIGTAASYAGTRVQGIGRSGAGLVHRGAQLAGAGIAAIPSVGTVAGLAGAFGAYTVKQTADEVMNLDGRLRAVTETDAERLEIEKQIYEVSQRNRQSMTAIGDLYTKVARAAKPMGYTNEQSMRVADIVSKALTSGGASTAEAESTILQLGQALQAGTLQGDELASLRENGGTLMTHMAAAMGVTVADLKDMGAQGELTSQRVMDAILASGNVIDDEFSKMPMTIGQALQKAENRFSRFIMRVEQKTGIFSSVANGIDSFFNRIERYSDVFDLLNNGPGNSAESQSAFSSAQRDYPILDALATRVLPTISSIVGSIGKGAAILAAWWDYIGGNKELAETLSNVLELCGAIWDALYPLVSLFAVTLVGAVRVFLGAFNTAFEVIRSAILWLIDQMKNSMILGWIFKVKDLAEEAANSFANAVGRPESSGGSTTTNTDSRTQSFVFNVNSADEANTIGSGFPELSPNV